MEEEERAAMAEGCKKAEEEGGREVKTRGASVGVAARRAAMANASNAETTSARASAAAVALKVGT